MVVTKKDTHGRIIAYCEYQIVDEMGKQDKGGFYTFINDIWLHEAYRPEIFRELMRKMVRSEMEKFPQLLWLYFKRDKHDGRIKMYDIRRFI